jgi:DNA polymerase
VAKLAAFKRHRCHDGRMRDNLQYHAAHTGRWGGKGAQTHNLPRGLAVDVDTVIEDLLAGVDGLSLDMLHDVGSLGAISSALRGCLTAAPGRDLIAGDFKTVEARGCAWLTDHSSLLAMFARDAEVYKWMAALIYGVSEDDVDALQRQVGKSAVLGCGFGCGPARFHAQQQEAGLRLAMSEAEHAVFSWRDANRPIVDGWYTLDRCGVMACRYPGELVQCFRGRVMFFHNGRHLFVRLPNGRRLTYWQAHLEWDADHEKDAVQYWGVNAYTKQWTVERTWGGKWMENIVQAMCRDLLAEAMKRLRRAAYALVLSVHDEIIAEVAKTFGNVAEFERIMCASEAWATGFPVSAKAWRGERYHK